jgi:ABC-type dipeptide/oligopeptide/nickel transport system permease component
VWRYLGKRFLAFVPLMFGVVFITFAIVRLLPGNPAYRLAGTNANEAVVEAISKRMGLDKPITTQFVIYLQGLARGDFGLSWNTSNPVAEDLKERFPATLELITIALANCIVLGLLLGSIAALKPKGVISRIATAYGTIAGAIADFWIGLMLIFCFYYVLKIVPAPIGRFGILNTPPTRITGFLIIDSVLAGNWTALGDSLKHLFLPVATLTICFTAPIMKMARSSFLEILGSDFIGYARVIGLPRRTIARYALRNALPPVVTMIGYLYGFLLGGAVLVETVFAWGGLGQYVTQGVANKDYAAIQGFMVVAGVFSMLVYLAVDLVHMAIDPRIRR